MHGLCCTFPHCTRSASVLQHSNVKHKTTDSLTCSCFGSSFYHRLWCRVEIKAKQYCRWTLVDRWRSTNLLESRYNPGGSRWCGSVWRRSRDSVRRRVFPVSSRVEEVICVDVNVNTFPSAPPDSPAGSRVQTSLPRVQDHQQLSGQGGMVRLASAGSSVECAHEFLRCSFSFTFLAV